MLFNSGLFLFGFLPFFLLLYFRSPNPWRNGILLCASMVFYAWAEPIFIFWALASALLDYRLGMEIANNKSPRLRKILVGIGVMANLALLGWFKYAIFTANVIMPLLNYLGERPFNLPKIVLPIAISFIVFEKITYIVDIYRGSGKPAHNLTTYLLYVFYFPKLLAGPIIRYCDIEKQLLHRNVNIEDFRAGLVRFISGLGKKVLIADHVGHYADQVFSLDPALLNCGEGWLGVVAFTIQIYFDFSGYSDMAIGISQALGFKLKENFNHPYLATSFTDFWRRWHISLSTWIREYVYIPLGGNRCSTLRGYTNLYICFMLSGLWHGAAWTFVIWGSLHGIMLMIDRAFWLNWQKHIPIAFNRILTFCLVMLSWIVFRSPNMQGVAKMVATLFSPNQTGKINDLWFSPDIAFAMLAGMLLILLPLIRNTSLPLEHAKPWKTSAELAGSLALLLVVIGRMAVSSFNAFLYFRF